MIFAAVFITFQMECVISRQECSWESGGMVDAKRSIEAQKKKCVVGKEQGLPTDLAKLESYPRRCADYLPSLKD